MSLFEIKDHAHEIARTEKNQLEHCIAEIYKCQESACEYKRIEFTGATQTGLEAYE